MKPYVYHSPSGPRPVFADKANEDGTFDLFTEDGDLDIGSCPAGSEVGQCEPAGSAKPVKEEKEEAAKESPKDSKKENK